MNNHRGSDTVSYVSYFYVDVHREKHRTQGKGLHPVEIHRLGEGCRFDSDNIRNSMGEIQLFFRKFARNLYFPHFSLLFSDNFCLAIASKYSSITSL